MRLFSSYYVVFAALVMQVFSMSVDPYICVHFLAINLPLLLWLRRRCLCCKHVYMRLFSSYIHAAIGPPNFLPILLDLYTNRN